MGDRNHYVATTQSSSRSQPRTLSEFRQEEGRDNRKRRLQALWRHIVERGYIFDQDPKCQTAGEVETTKAEQLRTVYEKEFVGRVGGHAAPAGSHRIVDIEWKDFKKYAEAKEVGAYLICSRLFP